MRQREERTAVRLPARLRDGASWSDATILNLSNNGVMFRCGGRHGRGDYLELRRGRHTIVARIMWSSDGFCGAKLQDPIRVRDVIADRVTGRTMSRPCERRRLPRAVTHDARDKGRCIEFAIGAVFVLALATMVFSVAREALGGTAESVQAAISGK